MASLLDIAPLTETVSVRGTDIPVTGVSAKGIAHIMARFPEVREMMVGREVSVDRLIELGGDAVGAIIAAGTGNPGDPDHERIAAGLLLEEQADLLAVILRVTLPKGVGPLVEKLTAMGGALGVEA
jgi:hypothetical protein